MNPDRIRAAIRTLYPDHMTPTARNVLERILDDENHEAPVTAGAFAYPNQGEVMTESQASESIPSEHDEEVCSKGETLCQECYAAGADCGPV